MASLTQTHAGSDADQPVASRATPAQRRLALSLLLLGKARPQDPAVDEFMNFAAAQHMDIDELWIVFRRGEPVSSVMLVPSIGRTAIVFLSQAFASRPTALETALLHAAAAGQDPQRVRLVQAILDPGQDAEAKALLDAGFRHLAYLIYMQRSAERGHETLALDPELRVLHWSEAHREVFARNILASYEQTLDCPGLLGLRQIEDVIAGHMASGKFVPELWYAVTHRDRPVAVMLLNLVPQRRTSELVYLGIAPAWRGKGLGRRLLEHGLSATHRHGASSLTLAVDDQNGPAMRLYESMRFAAHARKRALIFPVG